MSLKARHSLCPKFGGKSSSMIELGQKEAFMYSSGCNGVSKGLNEVCYIVRCNCVSCDALKGYSNK